MSDLQDESPLGDASIRLTAAGRVSDNDLLLMAAALSWAAAAIHAVVIPEHFREWIVFGVFFVVIAMFQFGWGARVYARPGRRLLQLGAAVNLAVAAVWMVSRTVGIPAGPEPWHPEGVGLVDVMATLDELLIVALAGAVLAGRRPPRLPTWCAFYPVVVISLLSAMLGGGHQH